MIANKRKVWASIIILVAFFSFIAYYFFSLDKSFENKIYPHVFVNKIDFGGKDRQKVSKYFTEKNSQLAKLVISVSYEQQPIATFSGEQLNIHYDGKGMEERAFMIGRSSNLSSRIYQKISTLILKQKFVLETKIEYDRSIVNDFVSDCEDTYNKPAKNALFKFENGRVISFSPEENGLGLESVSFKNALEKKISGLEKKPGNFNVEIASKTIVPEITLAKANNYGIEELIAVGKSDYTHSIPERTHNIILAASKFDGVLIPKNEVFSFNETVGDISSLTGYKPAYIIKNGRTVLGDGGGVCQVSTTLFRAALNAGLPIVERHAHAYRVGYYENDSQPGFDATVFAPTNDLKIKNDTPAYILVQTEIDKENNLLYFKLYGKKDNRRSEISKIALYDLTPPPPSLYQDDPTLKKGVIKQVDYAASGGKASFHYQVTKDNQTIIDQDFLSLFKPWQAVYLVGTAD